MIFYTLSEKEPTVEEDILVKLNDKDLPYYVVTPYKNDDDEWEFVEAGGECYSIWFEEEVIAWCPLSELDKKDDNIHLKKVIKYKPFENNNLNSAECKEFNSIVDLFKYIENKSKGAFKAENIYIGFSSGENNMLGWKSIRPVMAKKSYSIFDEGLVPIHENSVVVGACDLGEREAE